MVGFIIKTPLTNHHICSTLFDFLNHIHKVLLLFVREFMEILCISYVEIVFGLWFRRFEWTSQDSNFSITDGFFHLGMRKFFVNEYTFDQFRIFNTLPRLSNNFNQIKVDIFSFQIGNTKNSIDCNFSQVLFALRDYFGT